MPTAAETTPQPAQAAPPSAAKPASSEPLPRVDEARKLVKRNAYWALGAGLIAIPVVDLLAVTAVQAKMLKELSDFYKVKFFEDKAKTIVGALITGLGGLSIAGMIGRSLFKLVPGVGVVLGLASASALSGALTLAVGNLFIMHYESGGTLLDFDVNKMREHFKKEFESAKKSVEKIKADEKAASDPAAP